MNWTTTQAGVLHTLRSGVGLVSGQAMWGNLPAAQRPAVPFLLLRLKDVQDYGMPTITQTDSGLDFIITTATPIKFTVACDYFGPGATGKLSQLRNYIFTEAAKSAFLAADVGLAGSASKVQSIPELYGATPTERAIVEVYFNATEITTETIRSIHTVTGESSVTSAGTTLTSPYSITIVQLGD